MLSADRLDVRPRPEDRDRDTLDREADSGSFSLNNRAVDLGLETDSSRMDLS